MFAIAFDLVVSDTAKHHPKGVSQAYIDIGNTLQKFGFNRIQGSVYVKEPVVGSLVCSRYSSVPH